MVHSQSHPLQLQLLGIAPDVSADVITSPEYQVWRFKTGIPEPMLAGSVACLIQTPFFLDLLQFNRLGAVKERMYTENLMQVRVPYYRCPSNCATPANRRSSNSQPRGRLDTAGEEVETMILSTKKVGTL